MSGTNAGISATGGTAAVAVDDSPTVDLEGDGTPGTPITAAVRLSGDVGNTLTAGSDGGLYVPTLPHGIATLTTALNLVPTASGAWTDTDLTVTLPEAGTYQLDAAVRAYLLVGSPSEGYIQARLLDTTAGAVVPDSEALVLRLSPPDISSSGNTRGETTAPITVEYAVTGPTVIRLQASRTIVTPTVGGAMIRSDASGRTTLRYRRIA